MSLAHGKNTVIKINSTDISPYTKNSKFGRKADVEKVTPYGKDSVILAGSLLSGSFDMDGNYDSTATTGPSALLQPLLGELVSVIRQPEGAGSGKPQNAFSAVLASYEESSPSDGYIMWSATLEISDDVNNTAQS